MDNKEAIGEMFRELREGIRPLEARAEKAFISWLKTTARHEAITGRKWLKPMLDSPRSMFHVGYMLGAVKESNQTASTDTEEDDGRG